MSAYPVRHVRSRRRLTSEGEPETTVALSYLVRRFGFYLLAAWVSLTLNFAIPRLMPGDPAQAIAARLRGELSPEALSSLRTAFGVEGTPLWRQYFDYFGMLLRGDLGVSVGQFPAHVSEVIGQGLVWTLYLSGGAVIMSFALGTVLGALTGFFRAGLLDRLLPPALLLLGSFPYFWLAMFALSFFGYRLDWVPVRHAYDDDVVPGFHWDFLTSVARHTVLPAFVLVLGTLGGWLLRMRNTMISSVAEDYVVFAQAKGLSRWRVLVTYAGRNALLPNVTSFGMALGFVLSGSLLTEVVFAYPGLGFLLLESVQNQDYPTLQGLFLCLTLGVLVANAMVDVVTVLVDPRARAR
jgi:peptide/nickel transport system permease protein